MTQSEKLVFAAAFAISANETSVENHHRRAAEALRAGYDAVDLLRAARELATQGNVMYADEKIAYNAALERKERPAVPKYRETTPIMLKMLDEFLEHFGG